jgi:hypothetical protein
MTDNEWYEIRAEAFHQMRGLTAPGKDSSMATNTTNDLATRTAAWHAWNGVHSNVLGAMRNAIEWHEKRPKLEHLVDLIQIHEQIHPNKLF